MAKTTKPTSVVNDTVVTDNVVDAVDNMDVQNEKIAKKMVSTEPLRDTDEIKVISLIPNVSYKDSKTGDMYSWDTIGHVEFMTFDTLKNMWRNYKGYFRNMWLKPMDARVINQFGLTKTFEKYEFLMDASNYTKKNADAICEAISSTPNGLKFAICDKVKNFVIDGEVSDVAVIRTLERLLHIDLVELL